jgi:transposase
MTIGSINITETLENVKKTLAEDKKLSPSIRSLLDVLVLIITLLCDRLNMNSRNSSKPPSSDPNREKKTRKSSSKKPGGQKGHNGKTLEKVEDPDVIKVLKVDRSTLPKGKYTEIGYEARQVFDIQISRVVTEYQAEILEDENGNVFTAPFPLGVVQAAQYGETIRAHAVYMSQYQLIPYERITEHFSDQLDVPISAGSLFNFNKQAYDLLEDFEKLSKDKLANSQIAHADETSANINGKRHWLHCFSNEYWTHVFPHQKRGTEAMDEIGILPRFSGTLCHDHWKPYYKYNCTHSLCNAHHLRELTRAWEQDEQQWAKELQDLLVTVNQKTADSGGILSKTLSQKYRQKYRDILSEGEMECPPPEEKKEQGQRGRVKKTKSRNLLERLRDYEDDVLRFMNNIIVPFTNNQGERDIRMTKVQQKISGCFRSEEGAKIFCRVRSYLSTCKKQGITSSNALELLFKGQMPNFID